MTRYRLPEVLGGGEIEADERFAGVPGAMGGRPEYHIDGTGIALLMPRGVTLIPVQPPIPDEPEPGPHLIGDVLCVRFDVPAGWTAWHWQDTSRQVSESDSWHDVWNVVGGPDVTIRRLVPECGCCDGLCSAAEARAVPEPDRAVLPWTRDGQYGGRVQVGPDDLDHTVWLGVYPEPARPPAGICLNAAGWRALAAAALTAANQLEGRGAIPPIHGLTNSERAAFAEAPDAD